MTAEPNITRLLHRWRQGDAEALEQIVPAVYDQLQRLARAQLRRDSGATIQATELVAEAYLRLIDVESVDWQGRAHFLSMAARLMRQILVERYRRRNAARRGGEVQRVTLVTAHHVGAAPVLELDHLEQALNHLERLDPRQADVVTLKFFGGLSTAEIACVLGLSEATIKREWAAARIWLFDALR